MLTTRRTQLFVCFGFILVTGAVVLDYSAISTVTESREVLSTNDTELNTPITNANNAAPSIDVTTNQSRSIGTDSGQNLANLSFDSLRATKDEIPVSDSTTSYRQSPDIQAELRQSSADLDGPDVWTRLTPEFIASPLFSPARASRELANLHRQGRISQQSVASELRQKWKLQASLRQQINTEANDSFRDELIQDFARMEVDIRQLNNQSRQQEIMMSSLEQSLRQKMQASRENAPYPGNRPPMAHYFQDSSPFSNRQQQAADI